MTKSLYSICSAMLSCGDEYEITIPGIKSKAHPNWFTVRVLGNGNISIASGRLADTITEHFEASHNTFEWRLNGADLKLFVDYPMDTSSGYHMRVLGDVVHRNYSNDINKMLREQGYCERRTD